MWWRSRQRAVWHFFGGKLACTKVWKKNKTKRESFFERPKPAIRTYPRRLSPEGVLSLTRLSIAHIRLHIIRFFCCLVRWEKLILILKNVYINIIRSSRGRLRMQRQGFVVYARRRLGLPKKLFDRVRTGRNLSFRRMDIPSAEATVVADKYKGVAGDDAERVLTPTGLTSKVVDDPSGSFRVTVRERLWFSHSPEVSVCTKPLWQTGMIDNNNTWWALCFRILRSKTSRIPTAFDRENKN